MTLRIPQDIADLIVDEIASRDDTESLLTCALISHKFLHASRRYIYRTVKMCGMRKERQLKKYFRIQRTLMSTPELAAYVRVLQLRDSGSDPFLITQPGFLLVLGMLKGIKELTIKFDRSYNFDVFAPELKRTFADVVANSTLEILTLENIVNLSPLSLEWIGCVPTVNLTSITFEDQKHHFPKGPLEIILQGRSLTYLSLRFVIPDNADAFVDNLLSPSYMLETLEVKTSYDIPLAIEITKKCSNSLITLDLPESSKHPDNVTNIDIGVLPNLRTIKLFANFTLKKPFHFALQILSKEHKEHNLQVIIIKAAFPVLEFISNSDPAHWEELDVLLSELGGLNKLVIMLGSELMQWDRISSKLPILRWLPRSYEKGIILLDSALYPFVDM
ncbi:hypothetical protein BDQ17DRAFT_1427478 [Cyathus striatus]|nr:hypothetical protein BDQ17DRAFT_1427478 [Cyathus striatus]